MFNEALTDCGLLLSKCQYGQRGTESLSMSNAPEWSRQASATLVGPARWL